jgi:hypothetical protein
MFLFSDLQYLGVITVDMNLKKVSHERSGFMSGGYGVLQTKQDSSLKLLCQEKACLKYT